MFWQVFNWFLWAAVFFGFAVGFVLAVLIIVSYIQVKRGN
jgi:hypothetical protein